jgi:prevent-host-death family protein
MTCMTYPEDNASNVTWTVAEAKAKFSEMMECARTAGPQTITKNGQPAVVIVSAEEWKRKNARQGSLVDFLAKSPLRGVNLTVNREKQPRRRVDL